MNELTILVVDDDPVIRRLLQQRLLKQGYSNTMIAEDGYQAETLLRKRHIDVVLTDLMMPGDIGGIEVLEIAKEININTEVILITAHSSIDTAVDAMKKGAADYLEKPINFDELFLRLDKITNFQSILKNAEDLRQAMDVTETAASNTILDLEMISANLQSTLDEVENILRDDSQESLEKISRALDRIAEQ